MLNKTHPALLFLRKYFLYLLLAVVVLVTIGRGLVPSETMFVFHDRTQFARIIEFTYSIQTLHIPPVYAPHFNFGIGYPIFLFYAPFAYWVSAGLYLLGTGVVNSVKLSMLFALIVGSWGMYAWLARRYAKPAAFVGALLFVSSPWYASEIFVRGNLATVWFLALAPWSLWALTAFRQRKIVASLLIAATLLTHNALSIIWVFILSAYGTLGYARHRTKRMKLLVFSVIVSGIFWVPALLQLGQTHATEIAKLTNFKDHFLCIEQIWTTSTWGFGGSTQGCVEDGMSFMLGKFQILLAVLGITLGPFIIKRRRPLLLEGLIAVWAIFLTLADAQPFWEIAKPLQVVQFPWRFLSIALIFISALGAAGIQILIEHISMVCAKDKLGLNKLYKSKVTKVVLSIASIFPMRRALNKGLVLPPLAQTLYTTVCAVIAVGILIFSLKYFSGRLMPIREVENQFASSDYIWSSAAYDVPEYVPKSVDYVYWQSFRTKQPESKDMQKLAMDFAEFQPNTVYQMAGSALAIVGIILIICLL